MYLQKAKKLGKEKLFFVGLAGHCRKEQNPEPNPDLLLVRIRGSG